VREKLHRNIPAIYGLAFFHSFMVIVPVIVPFFMSKGLSLADIFYLQAIYAATIVLLEAPSGYFADLFDRRTALLIATLPVLGHFGMAWIQGWVGIAMGLLIFVGRGLNQVILVNALNRRVPSKFRATANSFTSFLFRLSFIATGPLLGYVAQTRGLEIALNLLGLSSLALFFLVMLPLMQSVQSIQQRVVA